MIRFFESLRAQQRSTQAAIVAAVALGLWSASRMPAAILPEVVFPRVKVIAECGERPTEEMLRAVTRPLEDALRWVPGVREMRSVTSRGSVEINLDCEWRANMDLTLQRVQAQVSAARGALPEGTTVDSRLMTPALFPVLGFFNVYFFRYSFVSDHFQYLASMGALALAGAAIVTAVGRFGELRKPSRADTAALQFSGDIAVVRSKSFLLPAIPGIFLLSLVFLTWRQTAVYHDLVTLYTATLQKNPGCWMAHYNLGIILREQGDVDQALKHYRQAFALRPNYAEAHYNLARCLVETGQLDDAIEHYEKALKINPADPETHNNLGVTLFGIGRVDDAIVHYQKALAIWPGYAAAACNLANALIVRQLPGDLDDAIARYSMCLAQTPGQAEAQYNLASALLRKGRTDEAIEHLQKTLQLAPENADAHANLGSAFLAKGRPREAGAEYRNALRISPENVAALSNLAWLLATSSDPSLRNGPEAVQLAERADSASSRNDKHPTVLRILAAAYAEAGQFAEAKETAQHALEAANIEGNTTLAEALQGELALYDLGLPYHQ